MLDSNRLPLGDKVPAYIADLYVNAYDRFELQCFWSTKKLLSPTYADIVDAIARLKQNGDMSSYRLASQLEKACHASV